MAFQRPEQRPQEVKGAGSRQLFLSPGANPAAGCASMVGLSKTPGMGLEPIAGCHSDELPDGQRTVQFRLAGAAGSENNGGPEDALQFGGEPQHRPDYGNAEQVLREPAERYRAPPQPQAIGGSRRAARRRQRANRLKSSDPNGHVSRSPQAAARAFGVLPQDRRACSLDETGRVHAFSDPGAHDALTKTGSTWPRGRCRGTRSKRLGHDPSHKTGALVPAASDQDG